MVEREISGNRNGRLKPPEITCRAVICYADLSDPIRVTRRQTGRLLRFMSSYYGFARSCLNALIALVKGSK